MKHVGFRRVRVPVIAALSLGLAVGGTFLGLAANSAHAQGSLPALPPAKQAVIDQDNAMRAQQTNPNPVPPDPAAWQSIVPAPCSRDLSLLVTGLTAAHDGLDFPDWQASYLFNNEWVAADGSEAVQAGNVLNSTQGVITTEQWSPTTSCSPTGAAVYLAPADSGSLSIVGVAGSTVTLTNTSGTTWTFDLATDALQPGA